MADPWPTIHDEREVLAKDLSSLTDEQWGTAALCAGWTVRDVLGHMTATAKMTPPKFFLALAGAGFRFNEMTAREIAQETGGTPAGWVRPSSTAPTSGGRWAWPGTSRGRP